MTTLVFRLFAKTLGTVKYPKNSPVVVPRIGEHVVTGVYKPCAVRMVTYDIGNDIIFIDLCEIDA